MSMLLLACSQTKNIANALLPAKERYTGSLFRVGITLAEERNLDVLILSAKYGFITPETLIPYYDHRLEAQYAGAFPEGEGFYLGGSDYFGNAPDRFKPLVAGAGIGDLVSAAQRLLKDPGLRSGRGVTAELYKALITGKRTKQQLRDMLQEKFPNGHPRMHKTVDIQVRQSRLGDERGCVLCRDGDYYWLEKTIDA